MCRGDSSSGVQIVNISGITMPRFEYRWGKQEHSEQQDIDLEQ